MCKRQLGRKPVNGWMVKLCLLKIHKLGNARKMCVGVPKGATSRGRTHYPLVQLSSHLISDQKTKNETLQVYQDQYGSYKHNPVTTTAMDTPNNVHPLQNSLQCDLVGKSNVRPNKHKFYNCLQIVIYNIIPLVVK